MIFLKSTVDWIVVTMLAANSHAGVLDKTCSTVYKKLGSGPFKELTYSVEKFSENKKIYSGCVLRFKGDADKVTDAQRPERLFGDTMPHCEDGKIPADLPPHFLNKDGWCSDNEADGPDGTTYKTLKDNVFCIVEGNWNGGDASNPNQVPSSRFEVVVKCANR